MRVRAGAQVQADGTRRGIIDAEVLLGVGTSAMAAPLGSAVAPPVAPAPARFRRAPAPTPSRPRRNPLVLIGLAEPTVRVTGHPRMRARAIEHWQTRRRREQLLSGSVAALLAIVLLGWGALRSPLLAVESIAVRGVDADRQAEVLQVADVASGENVLDVDLTAVQERVEALPWVQTAVVARRLPSTVEVRVATRPPVLLGRAAGQAWLLDAEGAVLARVGDDTADLPVVDLPAAPVVGDVLADPVTLAVAQVAADMPLGMGEWVVGYEAVGPDDIDVTLQVPTEGGPVPLVVHLGRPIEIDRKAATIASLVRETVDRGMRPTGFDVRIPDRPVVIA